MSNKPLHDTEPTPEFNDRCRSIVSRWETGELPFAEAAEQMAVLGKEALSSGHLANQGRVEQLMGFMEGYRGNLNVSIHHFERARALYIQVSNQRRIAICDLNIGESYRYKGDFNRARALFDKAYRAFEDLDDPENEALAIGNRGQMFLSMGSLENARQDLLQSGKLARQLEYDSASRTAILCELYHAMTSLFILKDQFEDAWTEAMKAHKVAQAVNRPLERGFAYRAIAEVINAMGESPDPNFENDPDAYYQAANDAFREINIEGEMARTMFAQAKSLSKRGRRMTAARKLQLAMVIFTRLGMVDDAAKAAEAQLEVL
ncbi:MAG: hypothetical protein K8L97_15130 [Anaerolineae bacterium]|nr:hypothetical protein [Anaerolineae bacterium]